MRKNGKGANPRRYVPPGSGRNACLPSCPDCAKFPLAHLVAFQHEIFHAVFSCDGIHNFGSFATPTASPRTAVHAFHCRRPNRISSERIADAIASAMIFIDRRDDFTTNGSGPVARGRDDKAVSINPIWPLVILLVGFLLGFAILVLLH